MFCAFFGHRDYSPENFDCLLKMLEKLILYDGVEGFYVGNKGGFDRSVHLALKKMKSKYPYVKMFLVLDTAESPNYKVMSMEKSEYEQCIKNFELIVPEGIENVPKRYAMSYRNNWMIKECDIAVVYYLYSGTNTQKYVDELLRKGKSVVNIAVLNSCSEIEY